MKGGNIRQLFPKCPKIIVIFAGKETFLTIHKQNAGQTWCRNNTELVVKWADTIVFAFSIRRNDHPSERDCTTQDDIVHKTDGCQA